MNIFPATVLLISVTCVKCAVRFNDLSLISNFGGFNMFVERFPNPSFFSLYFSLCCLERFPVRWWHQVGR